MNERDLIATQTIKQVSEGGDKVRADLKATASAQDQLAASAGNLATITETSARRQTSAAAAFNAMARSMDPAARAFAELEKNQAAFNRAMNQNSSALDKAGQGLSMYRDRLNAAAIAAENLRRQQANASVNQGTGFNPGAVNTGTYAAMFGGLLETADAKAAQIGKQFGVSLDAAMIAGTAKSARDSASVFSQEMDRIEEIAKQKAMQAGKNFQDSLNSHMGIGSSGKSARDSAAVFEEAARAQDQMAASATKLRAAINPLEAEQGKLAAELQDYKKALDAGKISQTEFAAAHAMAGKRLGDFAQNLKVAGTAGRVMSGELVNMGYQLNDVVTGLALGQSPFMILAQQGGQVTQILQNSKASIGEFAKTAVTSFAGFFTAGRLAFGGIAGAVGLAAYALNDFSVSQQKAGQSLIGIGARTGTTIADINKFATANASATGLSIDQARASAIEFTKTGMIAVGQLKGLGDAVHGYSILTGRDATDATKDLAQALSGDLVKGAQELNKTYGFLNPAMEDNIRKLVNQGERAKAQQVIINAMASDNKKAEETVGSLARAWNAVWNAASRAKNAAGEFLSGGSETPEQELERLKKRQESLSRRGISGSTQERITELEGNQGTAFEKESNRIQSAGRSAVEGVLPGIQQVQQLEKSLGELRQAKEAANAVGLTFVDNGAEQIYKNVIAATQQATAETVRYHERVAAISKQWGNVGQSTAMALQAMQNALPVAQAWTEAGRMRAQQQATYNDLIDRGKTSEEAAALAAKQYELSKAAAVANAQKLVQASEDNLDKIRAQGTNMEAVVASSIAYRDAMQSGATATQASAIAANTLQASLAQAAQSAQAQAQALVDAENGTQNGILTQQSAAAANARYKSPFEPSVMPKGPLTFSADPWSGGGPNAIDVGQGVIRVLMLQAMQEKKGISGLAETAYSGGGGIQAAISAIKSSNNSSGIDPIMAQMLARPHGAVGSRVDATAILGAQTSNIDEKISAYDQLVQLQNAQTNDKATKISNLQAEMDWMQALPETISRDQKIVSLQQSIDALKNSTDANTAATSATLNPLYSQGHGALAIGYYKAATGLDAVVGGTGGTDSTPVHMMLTPGEELKVTPKGSTDNSRQTTIVQNFYGASNDNRRRNMRQASQGFAQSIAAIGR